MAGLDWEKMKTSARERFQRLPRWLLAAMAAAAVFILLLVLFSSGGPTYTPLYDGLTSRQGGQVIEELQKLGIPYSLNATGSVISVPASDLARARLRLGKAGVPTTPGGQAWSQLTHGSLTRGRAATGALSRRALESRLEKAVDRIHGVSGAHISLAVPQSTPFLGNQPHPKASVLLDTTGPGISRTQAKAIAGMVANSVPGLTIARVTVTNQEGVVLAPVNLTSYGKAQQQFAFENHIQSVEAQRIGQLLAPLVGRKNFRVSVSAAVDFDASSVRQTTYGPGHIPSHTQASAKRQTGSMNGPIGVPGALSNEPPPQTTAAARNARKVNGAATPAVPAAVPPASASGATSMVPRSSSSKATRDFDVDQKTTSTQDAPWHITALSVSVVLNKAALGGSQSLLKKIHQVVATAISVSKASVYVAAMPFAASHPAASGRGGLRALLHSDGLLQTALGLLAALFVLFGIALPLARWLRGVLRTSEFTPATASAKGPEPEDTAAPQRAAADGRTRHAVEVALSKSRETADVIRNWMQQPSASVATHLGPGPAGGAVSPGPGPADDAPPPKAESSIGTSPPAGETRRGEGEA